MQCWKNHLLSCITKKAKGKSGELSHAVHNFAMYRQGILKNTSHPPSFWRCEGEFPQMGECANPGAVGEGKWDRGITLNSLKCVLYKKKPFCQKWASWEEEGSRDVNAWGRGRTQKSQERGKSYLCVECWIPHKKVSWANLGKLGCKFGEC